MKTAKIGTTWPDEKTGQAAVSHLFQEDSS